MKLRDAIWASELRVEREAIAMGRVPKGQVVKEGTQYCVKNDNPADKNFGCWPSQEDAQEHVASLESYADGEPVAGAFGHAHIEPKTWFHPPSLASRHPKEELTVPGDDPRERNDKFGDVTKREEAYEQRMKLLKRQVPSGAFPVGKTGVEQHMANTAPLYASRKVMTARMRRMSAERTRRGMFVSYDRRGAL